MRAEIIKTGFWILGFGVISFTLIYSFAAPWWKTLHGRVLWTFAVSMSFLMFIGMASLIFGTQDWMIWFTAFGYLVLGATVWGIVVALVRVQILKALRRRAGTLTRRSVDRDRTGE